VGEIRTLEKTLTPATVELFERAANFCFFPRKPQTSRMAPKAPKTGTNPSLQGRYRGSLSIISIGTFSIHFDGVPRCCSRLLRSAECVLTRCPGIAVGMNKGHVVQRRELPPRPSRRKGYLSQKTKAVRSLIKEVVGYLPFLPFAKAHTYLVELLPTRSE
jgi:hypothetical protein